jgi:hypothetical protein
MPSNRYIASHEAMIGDYVPEPPADWPEDRKARLRRIVGALPRGWWTEASEPLLHEFLCAIESSERLGAIIDGLDAMTCDAHELNRILSARDREAKRVLSLARTMRLSQLSMPPRPEGRDSPIDERLAPWSA